MHDFQSEIGGRNRGREAKWRFQTSLDFEKKKSVSEPFSVFFENNSP